MADIRLQDYVAKIKDLIRSVRLDEAIAHCQHILRHYPKHIETYSLLGEACLEKQLYREAIEFFQRTLGADPENLMARVGLGVIYDEQGAFPEAIWQLERAFELVPGNSEVRRELLRLYGQYDGIDKSRLKLTRGALGRLYSRNGLYERAIGEFHAVLRQDPELPDIRVALVEALWREGRQLEAVETCMDLLDALPNCLKANLILGEIWLRGGNEESAEQRLNVARALDPENRVAQELMGSDSPLPPEDVFVPELDAIPDEFDFALSAAPGAGVVVAAEAEDRVAAGVPEEEDLAPWGTDEELPEWLRDVGVTAEEPAVDLEPEELVIEPPPDEALPAEDMPEWLREVMGEDVGPPAAEPVLGVGEAFDEEFAAAEKAPEPLQETEVAELGEADLVIAGLIDDEEEEAFGAETPADEVPGGFPEWLEELVGETGPPVGEEPAPEPEVAAPVVTEPEEEFPSVEEEFLPDEDVPSGEVLAGDEPDEVPSEVPEWVSALGPAAAVGVAAVSLAGDEEEAPLAGEAPDQAADLDTVAAEEPDLLPVVEVEGEPDAIEEDLLSDEELPDWLRDLGVAEVAEADELPVAEVEKELLSVAPEAEAEDKVLPDEVVVSGEAPDEVPDRVPDWLRDLDDVDLEDAAEPVVAEVAEELAGEAPDEVPEGVPDWLRDLEKVEAEEAAVSAVGEAEEPSSVVEDVPLIDEIPDWLRDLDKAEVEEISASPVPGDEVQVGAEDIGEAPVPDSLRALVAAGLLDESDLESAMAEMSDQDLESQRAEEIPEWLTELVEEEAPAAAEAEPAVGEPLIQEIPTPVLEMRGVDELLVEEVIAEIVEPEPEAEVLAEEVVAEVVEPEPEAEILVEEVVAEVVEPEPEAEILVEEVVAEVVEPEPEAEVLVEEVVAEIVEPEPEAEILVEEVVAEVVEPEPEAEVLVEEVVAEIVEPEPEAEVLVEEVVAEVVEPEPEAEVLVEEDLTEIVEAEPEAEVLVEEAVLEVTEEEMSVTARADELLQQLKARPRDYASRLELARLYYDERDWDAALPNYEKLISARRFLPEIVADLEPLAEQDVEPARVYHMLGDAYMQQDQLDDALEMYRRARRSLTKR